MIGSNELDGIRPKNAVCTRCGYHIGGIEIKDGMITCPECGHDVVFELTSPSRPVGYWKASMIFRWVNIPLFIYFILLFSLQALLINKGVQWFWATLIAAATLALLIIIGNTLWKVLRRVAGPKNEPTAAP